MAAIAVEVSYSGDYSGTATTSFDIGPYNSPFTVTVTAETLHLWALAAELQFGSWNLGSYGETTIILTADNSNPEIDLVAWYANIEPTPVPDPTTLPSDYPGTVFMSPMDKSVLVGESFTWEVHASTGSTERLAAYGIEIMWPVPQGGVIMTVETSIGTNGVEVGTDGFVAAVNPNNAVGTLTVSGFDTTGKGPSTNLHLLTVHYKAGPRAVSSASVTIAVNAFVNPVATKIGIPRGLDAVIRVKDYSLGDVNTDGRIDIIDALLVAQYYVGLNPAAYTAPIAAGDSNQDGDVTIVDALMMAQYYVGLCNCPYFP